MTETDFKIIKEFSKSSNISQRELSKKLGISLGKTNYIIRALLLKGYIKIKKIKKSNKNVYMYILTPEGIKKKIELTYHFIKLKSEEYERIKNELVLLKQDVENIDELIYE